MTVSTQFANVRYVVDDVQAAVDFCTSHFGFAVGINAAPAFADVTRGPLRLLLSGPTSSGARATPAGLSFRSELVTGPGGRQILLADPAGNLVELFEAAGHRPG